MKCLKIKFPLSSNYFKFVNNRCKACLETSKNLAKLQNICIHLLKVLGFTVCALILCMYSTRVMHSIEGASLRSQRIDSIGEGPSAV